MKKDKRAQKRLEKRGNPMFKKKGAGGSK